MLRNDSPNAVFTFSLYRAPSSLHPFDAPRSDTFVVTTEEIMDAVFVVLAIGFFALSWKLVDGCEKL